MKYMNNSQKRFIVPLLLIAVVTFIIVGGVYLNTRKQEPQKITDPVNSIQKNDKVAPSINTVSVTSEIVDRKTYTNRGYGFSFSYPADFKLSTELTPSEQTKTVSYIPICHEKTAAVCLRYLGDDYKNTNFSGAGISITTTSVASENKCAVLAVQGDTVTDKVSIGGIIFYHNTSGEVALGHYASDEIYRFFYNGNCFKMVARVTSTNYDLTKDSNPESKKFDEASLLAKLKSIVSSFTFSEPIPPTFR